MRTIQFLISLFIITSFQILGQATIYNANETQFYSFLDSNCSTPYSETQLQILFNDAWGNHIYDNTNTYDGNSTQTIVFLTNNNTSSSLQTDVTIKNLTLKNYVKIVFYVRNFSNITFENCTFENINSLQFLFATETELYSTSKSTSITIDNCSFIETDLSESYGGLIYFTRDQVGPYANDFTDSKLENIVIKNTIFRFTDNRVEGDTLDRTAIRFSRTRPNYAYKNISIEKDTINFNTKNYRSHGIVIEQPKGTSHNFTGLDYSKNCNIHIKYNTLISNSDSPNHGIFVQGPYKNVNLIRNKVDGFGLVFPSTTEIFNDGAIHLYGARTDDYCDDFIDVIIDSNEVLNSKSTCLRLNGVHNATVSNNYFQLGQYPPFVTDSMINNSYERPALEIGTGDYHTESKQSENINVVDNEIDCCTLKASIGILNKFTKDALITHNSISNPTTSGICYFGTSDIQSTTNVGTTTIENNTIDFGNQNLNDLVDSNKYLFSTSSAAVNFDRRDNGKHYTNEILNIRHNSVQYPNDIPDVKFKDNTDSYINYWLGAGFYGGPWYVGDFDGDDDDDILCKYNSLYTKVWFSDGNNFSSNYQGYWYLNSISSDRYIGDFNGDGKDDILVTTNTNYGAAVWPSNGSSFNKGLTWLLASNNGQWHVGDFNGDGMDDLLSHPDQYGDAELWVSTGGSFIHEASVTLCSFYGMMDKIYVGDFNGDSQDDIAMQYSIWGGAEVLTYDDIDSFEKIGSNLWLGASNNGKWYIGDFNSDGKDDIMCPTSSNHGAKVWFSNGSNFMSNFGGIWLDTPNNGEWYVGDFDGSGEDDILGQLNQWGGAIVYLSHDYNGQMNKQSSSELERKTDNLPTKFELSQNYPNPFNPSTTINYSLNKNTYVSLIIYDMLGREVRTLVNESESIGYKRITWDGKNNSGVKVSSGMYIYRIVAGEFIQSRKMMLLK